MKAKTYIYEANGFIRGYMLAKSKREVKKQILKSIAVYCPTRGLETMKIERVKE